MDNQSKNLNQTILEGKIESQKADALEEISRILKRVDSDISRKERGTAMITGLQVLAQSQVDDRTKEIFDLRAKQAAEKNELTLAEYERLHKNAMDSLVRRLSLAVEASEDMPSLKRHLDMLGTSPDTDFFALLKKEGITLDEAAKQIPADLILIEEKLKTGKPPMDESDWSHVEGLMRRIARLEPVDTRKALANISQYAGYVLLSELNPEQRMLVLERMPDDPEFHKLLVNFTATNYLTVAEALDLLAKAEPKHPELKDQYLLARKEIDSDGMRRYQTDIAALQHEALRVYEMNYHDNFAGKYGNPVTYLLVHAGEYIGITTMLGNFMANVNMKDLIHNPSKFMKDVAGLATNPCFIAGTAVTAGAVEYVTGGIGKGWLTGALANITKDRSLEADKKAQAKIDQVKKVLKNNPQLTELYYRHIKEIIALRNLNKEVNLQSLGIEYKDLSEHLKNTSKTSYDDNINQFAIVLADGQNGLSLKSENAQEEFIKKTMPKGFTEFKN